jgi:hypothetical protein
MSTTTTATHANRIKPSPNGAVLPVTSLGGGIQFCWEKNTELSYGECKRLLEMAGIPGERNIRDTHVKYLHNAMSRGTFRPEITRIVTAHVKTLDEVLRLNGRHTCTARLTMPADWPCKVRLAHYECEGIEDAKTLYAAIDRNAPRTPGNIVNAQLQGTKDFEGVPPRLLHLLASSLAYYLWPDANYRTQHDADDVAYLMKVDHRPLVCCVLAFMMKSNKKDSAHLWRASAVASMYETFAKNRKDAGEFWEAVRTGIGMASEHDPRLKLRNALINAKVRSLIPNVRSVTPNEMRAWCVHAWNCFRDGVPCKQLKGTINGKVPKAK